MNFEKWSKELKRICVEEFGFNESLVDVIDIEDFREYFNQGYTPKAAWIEEVLS